MAKKTKRLSINNCTIDYKDKKIIEETKDGVLVYDMDNVFLEWDGLDGIKLSLSQDVEIPPDGEEY